MHPTKGLVILCHVDDFLALGESEAELDKALEEVSRKIKLQELGEVSTFLRIEFSLEKSEKWPNSSRGYKSLKLHQTKYVKNILKRFRKDNLAPISTPI